MPRRPNLRSRLAFDGETDKYMDVPGCRSGEGKPMSPAQR